MTSSNILQQRLGEVTQRHAQTLAGLWRALSAAPATDPQALEGLAASLRIHLTNIQRDIHGLYNSAQREWDGDAIKETMQSHVSRGYEIHRGASEADAFLHAVRADIIGHSIRQFLVEESKNSIPPTHRAARKNQVDMQQDRLTVQLEALRPYLQLESNPHVWPEIQQALDVARKSGAAAAKCWQDRLDNALNRVAQGVPR